MHIMASNVLVLGGIVVSGIHLSFHNIGNKSAVHHVDNLMQFL